MSELDYIRNEALGVEEGDSTTVFCPFCDNAAPYAPSLSVTRTGEGILYNCYRVACSGKGFIGSMPAEYIDSIAAKPKPKSREYHGQTHNLSKSQIAYIFAKYGIKAWAGFGWKYEPPSRCSHKDHRGRLIMNLCRENGSIWGRNSKMMAPFTGTKKSINYISEDYPAKMHWCLNKLMPTESIILSESVLDATKCHQLQHTHRSAALLGTVFNDETIKCLLEANIKHVVLALDPDALAKAASLVSKYRVFFNTFKILSLSKDPKDLSQEEFDDEIVSNL